MAAAAEGVKATPNLGSRAPTARAGGRIRTATEIVAKTGRGLDLFQKGEEDHLTCSQGDANHVVPQGPSQIRPDLVQCCMSKVNRIKYLS
jgi:hypothetical protein